MSTPTPVLPWAHSLEHLPLTYATPSAWAEGALGDLDALLIDHAHCEQKAANAAIALVGRFPDHPGLARGMIALAHEEMRHFRQVLDRLEARGGSLTKPLPDPYVRELRKWGFKHRGGLGPLADLLLVSAFVEARSCERFRLLAEALLTGERDAELGTFYLRLADAEARHWELFRDLALTAAPAEAVHRRVAELAEAEGDIVRRLPLTARIH